MNNIAVHLIDNFPAILAALTSFMSVVVSCFIAVKQASIHKTAQADRMAIKAKIDEKAASIVQTIKNGTSHE